jgi:hypothetical protein
MIIIYFPACIITKLIITCTLNTIENKKIHTAIKLYIKYIKVLAHKFQQELLHLRPTSVFRP